MLRRKVNNVAERRSERENELEGVMSALDTSQAIIEFNPDGTIITANALFQQVMGYTVEQIKGRHHSILMPAEERDTAEYQQFWETLRSGEYVTGPCRRVNKRNDDVWLQASYCPVLNEQGNVTKVIKFASDITARTLTEVDVSGQLVAIHRVQAVIEFDLDGTVRKANDNFCNATGYAENEIVGKHHSLFLFDEDANTAEYKEFWLSMRNGRYYSNRCKRKNKAGEVVWLQASYNPIMDQKGKPIKVVKFATDITEIKQAEEDLENLITEASEVMSSLANGDLTLKMQGSYKNELLQLAESINNTIDQLSKIMRNVNDNANTLAQSSSKLISLNTSAREAAHEAVDQTNEVATSTKQISVNVDEVARALHEMVTSVEEVSRNSTEAASVAEKAVTLAHGAKANVSQLAQSSTDIGAVIKVINSIADQTNLLALNATIEAARAGESGKGFAVVANEVKELAKETAKATEEVTVKISAIQKDSQVAVKAINDIGSTIQSISETQSSIAETVESQSTVSNSISRSVREVADGSTGIEEAISRASVVVSENQTRADDSQAISTELGGLAEELSSLVGKFKLNAA